MANVPWKAVVLIITILILGFVAWLGRYEIVTVPSSGEGMRGTAYRLDRWTKEVVHIILSRGAKVEIKP